MKLQQVEPTNSTIDMLDQLKYTHCNGDVILVSFVESSSSADNTNSSPSSLMMWLDHLVVREKLSNLHIPSQICIPSDLRLVDQSTLEAELTQRLVQGGAYQRFRGSEAAARALSSRFVDDLFRNVEQVQIAISQEAWSNWFMGIAWDLTVLAHDPDSGRRWLLTITDTG
uniref:Uncharacterized protein n=1 Tax=Helicotheca tamesis TaxID=374047 RepID=A0A7S2HVC1_9STRA|mmetsp:Transcript_283/g.307  ORF Transcript_283/g.307 Transcript_283/m.307 type:complete len:170 (+) Transcript_283:40-549(+)